MAEETKVWAKKIGSIWHGYHSEYPQIDERELPEEIAKKAGQLVERLKVESGGEVRNVDDR